MAAFKWKGTIIAGMLLERRKQWKAGKKARKIMVPHETRGTRRDKIIQRLKGCEGALS